MPAGGRDYFISFGTDYKSAPAGVNFCFSITQKQNKAINTGYNLLFMAFLLLANIKSTLQKLTSIPEKLKQIHCYKRVASRCNRCIELNLHCNNQTTALR